jgi:CHAT domain-containing protein/Tfp pilus assembly protein PilF
MIKNSSIVLVVQACKVMLWIICIGTFPILGQVSGNVDKNQIETLATQIFDAKNLDERLALTEINKSLISDVLIKEISEKTRNIINKAEYEKAERIITWLITIGEKYNNRLSIATGMYLKGHIYRRKGEFNEAQQAYEKSLKIAEQIDNKNLIANILIGTGIVCSLQGNYAQALDSHIQSLKIKEEIGDKQGIASILNNMGLAYDSLGNYTKALEYHLKSLEIGEEIGDKYRIAASLHNVGLAYDNQGNFTKALEYYLKSLEIREEIGDKHGIAGTFGNIGTLYDSQGNDTKALEYHLKSLKIKEEIGDKHGIAGTFGNIGNVHSSQGNYTQALQYYLDGLNILKEIEDKPGLGYMLISIGMVHSNQHNYIYALEYFLKSLTVFESIGSKHGVATSLHSLGLVYDNQRNYTQALEYYLKSLKIREEIGDKLGISLSLNSLASLHYKQGDFQKALIYSSKAASVSSEINLLNSLWIALFTQGESFLALNQIDSAQQALLNSIATIEKLRSFSISSEQYQQSFFQDKTDPYYAMVSLLIKKNDLPQALSYAERAKARTLLDALHSGRTNLNKAMSNKEVEQEQQLSSVIFSLNAQLSREAQKDNPDKKLISELESNLKKARLEYEDFHTSLYIAHPELKIQRGDIPPLSMDDVSQLLGNKTAILEYAVTDDITYLFVLTKDIDGKVNLQLYPIKIKADELTKLVEEYRNRIASYNLDVRRPAKHLYDILIKPAEVQLKSKSTLCIVPDKGLWELPFHALDKDGKTWIMEEYAIYYAPSLAVLRELYKKNKTKEIDKGTTLLAFGNPKLNDKAVQTIRSIQRSTSLEPLPFAEKEVLTLGELYGKQNSKVLVADQAKEEIAKREADKYKILHFATHGILDNRNPMYSKLMLAAEDVKEGVGEDGMLEAWEIMKMDLRADMAVLAACETARGKVGAGEGMIGMSWALFVAGVPTTVVSQWKVDSKNTTEHMIEFHKNIVEKRMSKAEAMQKASIKMMKDRLYHPYDWAGFVIIGKGD